MPRLQQSWLRVKDLSGIGSWLLSKLYIIPGIVVAISVHEFGHAKAAQLCGDRTSSALGRVSL